MSLLKQVAQLSDGGYWYTTTVDVDPVEGASPTIQAPSWCAWYGNINGTRYAVVRTPEPSDEENIQGIRPVDVLQAAFTEGTLAAQTIPLGRIGGQ